MKIGMILDAPFPPDVRVEKEARALIAAGHEVHLFCLDYEGKPANENYKGINLRRFRASKLEYKLSALAYSLPFYTQLMQRKIRIFINETLPEVIHVHDMVIAEAAMREANVAGLKVILDLHENRPEIMTEYRHVKGFPGNLLIDLNVWRRKQTELAKQANKCIVVTDLAKKNLVEDTFKAAVDVVVLPNTPSLAFSSLPINDEILKRMNGTFNLLYVGDTGERRGTADMIYAIAKLSKSIHMARLWIVGKSSFDEKLTILARQLGVEDKIHFEGWQSESLFPSYITGSQVCLSPLRRNIHHDSTFANKIFQYMAMGRPCVVSDSTAQADLMNDVKCGLVHEAGNVEDLAQKIIELYKDPELMKELGQNGQRAVRENWNWEKSSTVLTEIYSSI